MLDQKSRRIQDLKGLLMQAKGKIQLQRQQLQEKDKHILLLNQKLLILQNYQTKIQSVKLQNQNKINQHETNFNEFQKSIKQKDKTIASLQKQNQILQASTKNNQINSQTLIQIINKISVTQNQESKQQDSYVKLNEISQQLKQTQIIDLGINTIKNIILKIVQSSITSFQKIKDISNKFKIQEDSLTKKIQTMQNQIKLKEQSIMQFQKLINAKDNLFQRQIETLKQQYQIISPKQQLNAQYLKNVFIKLFVGTPQCIKMSLTVINSLLQLTDAEYKSVQKHFKT